MSLRTKLVIFMFAFVFTAVFLGGGVSYIFNSLNENLDKIDVELKKHQVYMELKSSVRDYLRNVKGYALTGDGKYGALYHEKLARVYLGFGNTEGIAEDADAIRAIGEDFQSIKEVADEIIRSEGPVGNMDVLFKFRKIEEKEADIFMRLDGVDENSYNSVIKLVSLGDRLRKNMSIYLGLLVSFSVLMFVFLVLVMRRIFGEPFRELLTATEKVASGDLSFRINSARRDEFGVISRRFDYMVGILEGSEKTVKEKLKETELLLDVARIAGMTPELGEALDLMVHTIANEMGKDLCAVFLMRPEKKAFCLEACNIKGCALENCIGLDADISGMVLGTLKPVIINDPGEFPSGGFIFKDANSHLIIPIVRDSACIGILALGGYDRMGFREDELDTGMILAHTIGSVVRNAELYAATKNQLKQLKIVYDLSRAITSVYEPDELLGTIASEIAKLINAKGCIIRLIEDGSLKIRSYYGLKEGATEDLTVPVGKGIAGWVAKEGRSLFVEDVASLPEELRTPHIGMRSAICVPLKVGDRIIGTMGLYDKAGAGGEPLPFTYEDLSIAEGFASISAVAMDKTRMHEEKYAKEMEVFEAKKRMDLLFDSVQGGIITVDRNYNVISANRYVERWIDLPIDDIIGEDSLKIFHARGGICPHCVSKMTFETGSINSITQSSGLNYAELTSYPLRDEKGEVKESVIFIQDITDRVLYQEEIMGLYKEDAQTKDYLESLINNSADAIVTSDLNGLIRSWNKGAERVYAYAEAEAVGVFLPFIPDFLYETEMENIDRIKRGEVLRDLETLRKTKDGRLIEVSLTLSPIKDAAGAVIGISGISRDISERKRVEKELIRRNQELSRLFFISSAMRGTLELDRLLRMVLTAVTMSDGLGFNRAILFLVDEEKGILRGIMGVGPEDAEEAWKIWDDLSIARKSLPELIRDIEEGPLRKDSFLDRLVSSIEVPLDADTVLTKSVREKTPFNVLDIKSEPMADMVLVQQIGTQAYAVVPIVSRDRVIGVMWVDNLFNKRPIAEEDMKFLSGFSNQVASAIENARLFKQVSLAEAELENIFSSISDMVYFTDREYTIKKINQAVARKIGLPAEQIIGKKCYEIFHGIEEPLKTCPHHRTVQTMQHFIEEYEDPYMEGAFMSSTSPIFGMNGEFLGTVHVVRDITEHKALRERLEATEKMAALGEVAARVAHEIRNPLVSVGGFAQRLERKLDGNLKEYATIIVREVGRLEEILREILGFVREVRLSRKKVKINELVESTLQLVRSEILSRKNNVVKEMDAVDVQVDPERIKEAVLNMITNANQATDNGTITLRTYEEGQNAVIEVSDTGCGIKDEDVKKIFDPFFTTRPTGTGLGLAVAKRIVEEHKGRITVETARGEGTKFRIYLPLKED
jgi:PAS domain S-box-containing protein